MGAVVAGYGDGWGGFLDARTVLLCGGEGGPSVWVRYVGYVPVHW